MRDYIERLRTKPEHVRHRIALGAAYGVTGVVAAGWLVALVATGALNFNASSQVAEDPGLGEAVAGARANVEGFLGAAAAAPGVSSSDPALVIVEGESTSTLESKGSIPSGSDTRIPF